MAGMLACSFCLSAAAANTIETVEQVSGTVTLSKNVDYVVTSSTPFAAGAVVNITNTDNAVLILSQVKPSKVPSLFSYIQINGEKASKSNCMVKMYGDGAIILPHPENINPLTVFTANDEAGDTESYAVGQRVSLKGTAMDNRISSFTLKRGYMVWFAQKADGTGYNRIWVADKEDLHVNMPAPLRKSASALRVSKWNDASKKGYAGWDPVPNTMLNTTWCYNWDAGINIWDDREYVTQHHHEGWPGIADVGNNGTSANILGNNEPENKGDDREQLNTVQEVLANWPQMMATGRRLGSPAVAGDYNWLYEFIDSIDARGWRCDFIAVHAYWYSDWNSWNSMLTNIHNRTRRPIWITEMNYGANWTGWPGSDRTGSASNQNIQAQHFNPIVDGLEETPWLERYAVYNWVEDCRKVWDNANNVLTKAGQYYADKPSAVGYDSRYQVVPAVKKVMKDPANLAVFYDKAANIATLTWNDYNGEFNYAIYVERKLDGGSWEVLAEVDQQDESTEYSYTDGQAVSGALYRIHIIDGKDKDRYTRSVSAFSLNDEVGDAINYQGETRYLGGNLFVNGDFDMGMAGWTNGLGEPIDMPYFAVVPVGSVDDGAYLQARSHDGKDKAGAIKTVVDVVPGADYYFVSSSRNANSALHYLYLSETGEKGDSIGNAVVPSSAWTTTKSELNTGSYSKAMFSCYYMSASSQIDKVMLSRVFTTPEEAFADGVDLLLKRAAVAREWLAGKDKLQQELDAAIAAATGKDADTYRALKSSVDHILEYAAQEATYQETLLTAERVVEMMMPGYEELQSAIDLFKAAATAEKAIAAYAEMKEALDACLPYVTDLGVISSPNFNNATKGWTTKCGTYTGGSQKLQTLAGNTSWMAQWTGISAEEGAAKTMAIKQKISGLAHGLYTLECRAATEFKCLSDQHAYMETPDSTYTTPYLSADYLDLPTVDNETKWQTLATVPVYVHDGDAVTIGFVGSKENAVDNAWMPFGDKDGKGDLREGWWAATDFNFRYVPMYRRTAAEGEWSTICLPYTMTASPNVKLYQLAGITSDYQYICLEEVSSADAGVPHIYQMTGDKAWFFQTGEPVQSATTTSYQLRGNFKSGLSVKAGYYVIENGEWIRATSSHRPKLTNFGACLMSVTQLPVYESWPGVKMKVTGAEGEIAEGIEGVEADGQTEGTVYTLGGQPVARPQQHGVYIQQGKGTKARKVLK